MLQDPPPLLLDPQYKKALAYHASGLAVGSCLCLALTFRARYLPAQARDDEGALVLDSEVQRRGWARISLRLVIKIAAA